MQIILIDDDEIAIFGMTRLIAKEIPDADILCFPNGLEAFDYFKSCDYSTSETCPIIFLDLNMPIMDGWQFLEKSPELFPQSEPLCQLYVLSSSINEADIESALNFTIVKDYLTKPLTKERIQMVLEDRKN